MTHSPAHDDDVLNTVKCFRVLHQGKGKVGARPQSYQGDCFGIVLPELIQNLHVGRCLGWYKGQVLGVIDCVPEVVEDVVWDKRGILSIY